MLSKSRSCACFKPFGMFACPRVGQENDDVDMNIKLLKKIASNYL